MESIEIYDYVKKKNFHVFVPQEVAERCRIDKIYAEELYTQIRDQNIEEGSTLEIETEIIELPKSSASASYETSYSQGRSSQETWSQEETLKLIKTIQGNHKKTRKLSAIFWLNISKELSKSSVYKSPGQCKSKWGNLKESYKTALKTQSRSKFSFYDEVEAILKDHEDSQFSGEQSDIFGTNEYDEYREPSQEGLEQDEREFWTKYETRRFLNLHFEHKDYRDYCKTPKQFWTNISQKLADEGISKTPEKCFNKWKNLLQSYRKCSSKPTSAAVEAFPYYLFVKKILDDKNQILVNEDLENKNVGKESQKLPHWSEEETLAIIKMYKKYKDDYDKFAIKKHFWTLIAKALEKEGYLTRDADKCRDKWRSMMRTYERYLNNRNRSTFEFGKVLDDLFNESLQDSETDRKEVIASQTEKVTNGDDKSEPKITEPGDHSMHVKQEVGVTKTWSYEESFALIDTFEKYKSKYKDDESNVSLWEHISTDLNAEGIKRSTEDCKNYWNTLFEMYKSHQNLNMGNSRFIFAKSMERIFKVKDEEMETEEQDSTEITNKSPNKCHCREKLIHEKRKRHIERMEVIKKRLEIEEKKVKTFEEYVRHLKNSA